MLPTPEPSQTRPSRTSRKRILLSDGTFSQSFYTHDESQRSTPVFEYIEPPSKRRRGLSFEVFQDPIPVLESPQRDDSNDLFGTQRPSQLHSQQPSQQSSECTTIRQPLLDISPNITRPRYILDCIKPNALISWTSVKKWQKDQPNNHTSEYYSYFNSFNKLTY
jgi:hypothetical protein